MKRLATGMFSAVVAAGMLVAAAEAGNNKGAAIIVHTGTFSGKTTTCAALPTAITACEGVTPANPTTAATHAFVAVYASQLLANDPSGQNLGLHLVGIDFGIDYQALGETVGLTKCADLELPTDGVNPEGNPYPAWPGPGSGNSLIWGTMQQGALVLIGFFDINYLTYGPVLLSIGHHPDPIVPARMLDEESNFDDITLLGTAGLGGAVGSNDCPIAVKATSWGSIKSLYKR